MPRIGWQPRPGIGLLTYLNCSNRFFDIPMRCPFKTCECPLQRTCRCHCPLKGRVLGRCWPSHTAHWGPLLYCVFNMLSVVCRGEGSNLLLPNKRLPFSVLKKKCTNISKFNAKLNKCRTPATTVFFELSEADTEKSQCTSPKRLKPGYDTVLIPQRGSSMQNKMKR